MKQEILEHFPDACVVDIGEDGYAQFQIQTNELKVRRFFSDTDRQGGWVETSANNFIVSIFL